MGHANAANSENNPFSDFRSIFVAANPTCSTRNSGAFLRAALSANVGDVPVW